MGGLALGLFWVVICAGILGMAWWMRRRSKSESPASTTRQQLHVLMNELNRTQLAYERVVALERFKASFWGRASHELRSPINQIVSLHQLILEDLCEDPAEEREFLRQANEAAMRLLTELDQLIHLSKLEAGFIAPDIQPVQLTQILQKAEELTRLTAANRGVRLEVQLPEGDVYVLVDPKWLQQVLVGLIDRAIAAQENNVIQLHCSPHQNPQYVYLWLDDERPATAWQEPLEMAAAMGTVRAPGPEKSVALPPPAASIGLSLEVASRILTCMGCSLDLLATSAARKSATDPPSLMDKDMPANRIQCTLPRALEDNW